VSMPLEGEQALRPCPRELAARVSPAEVAVVELAAAGYTNAAIARRRRTAISTVKKPSTTLDPALSKYTSEWGRDPVWTSTGVSEPLQPHHFAHRVVTTPEPVAYDPTPPPLSTGPYALQEDTSLSVSVVGFSPEYSQDRRLWFVDIEMRPGDSYFPFVRLAMARFQPHSVRAGEPTSQHLSRVTRTEFMQLVPDRTASITFDSDKQLLVTVAGVGAYNAFAMATAAPSQLNAGAAHRLIAQVQERELGSNNDLLWTNIGQERELDASGFDTPDLVTWSAQVHLPIKPALRTEYRLLIKEMERYMADPGTADGMAGNMSFAERLVYACGIPLKL
jgi:hypothetical protein